MPAITPTCRLWLHTDDDGMWELCLKTSKVQRVMTEGVSSLVMGPNLGGQLCGYGILGDDIVCAQMGPDGSIASCTPLVIKWPEGFGDGRWSTQILGCSMDGSLLIAAGIGDSDDESDEDENEEEEEEEDSEDGDPVTLSVIFHVTAAGKATVVVGSAEGVGDDSDNDSNSHQENRDQGSEHSSSDSDGSEEPVDVWEGMTIAEGVTCVPENFYDWTLDASGAIIGFTCTGHVIRVELAQPLIPAHLQAESAANRDKKPGINFESCRAAQLRADWGDLLASGEGADVQLRCAEGAVVKAHALVLLARWEYYRVLQRSIAAGMTGGRAPGEVDVSEHSAATVQLILQHLYTGRVQLLGAHSTHHTLGNGNNSSSSSSTRSDGPAGAGGRGNQEVESAAAANSSGASSQESEATTEAVPGGACSTGGLLEMQQCGASGPPSKHLQCDCGSQSGPSEQQSLLLGQHLAQLVPLARAADALLLPDLRDACLKVAQQELAPGNALPLLLAAHEAQVSPLQTAALEYTLNHIKGGSTLPVPVCLSPAEVYQSKNPASLEGHCSPSRPAA
jgi:hypothetical protein